MSSTQESQTQQSQTPAISATERWQQLAEAKRVREEAARKAEEERLHLEEEEHRQEAELARIEEDKRLKKEHAEHEWVEHELQEQDQRRQKLAEQQRMGQERGLCYKHKKRCMPMTEEGPWSQGMLNDRPLWTLAFAVARIAEQVEKTLDLVDKALLKYIGQPVASSSRGLAETTDLAENEKEKESEEKGSEERPDDDIEQD